MRFHFKLLLLLLTTVSLLSCGAKTGTNGSPVINKPPDVPSPDTDTTPPLAPTGLSFSGITDTKIVLSWQTSTDPDPNPSGIAGYFVYRNDAQVNSTPMTDVSFTDTGRTAGTSYKYEVVAVDVAENESPKSESKSTTTLAAADTTNPSAPTGLSASANGPTQINLLWTASEDPPPNNSGIQGYIIYRNGAELNLTPLPPPTIYADNAVSSGTTYSYQVLAVDNAGNRSALSDPAGAKTPCVDNGNLDADCDGYSVARGDCDDNNAARNPGAGDTWENGVDLNCKPDLIECQRDVVALSGIYHGKITLDAANWEPYTANGWGTMISGVCAAGPVSGLTGSYACSSWGASPSKGYYVEKLSAVRFRINVRSYDVQGRQTNASCEVGD
ncbi:MAG: fibronectin type III domain-containing protein [Pseudomonadota bacterium]